MGVDSGVVAENLSLSGDALDARDTADDERALELNFSGDEGLGNTEL